MENSDLKGPTGPWETDSKRYERKGGRFMAEQDVECCQTDYHHVEMVSRWKEDMPDEDTLYDLADLYKIFGDSTRIKIMYLLLRSEMCVCDIADVLNMNQSAISHQLRVLKQNKLVKNKREGKSVIYSLADQHVMSILSQGMEHILE